MGSSRPCRALTMDNSKFCCETALCICCNKASADRSSAKPLAHRNQQEASRMRAGLAHDLIPKMRYSESACLAADVVAIDGRAGRR